MLTCRVVSCKGNSIASTASIFTVVLALGLGACVSTTIESQSFRVNNNSRVESAQVATDADFGRYDRLLATELGIYFPQSHSTTAEDQQRIRQIFRDAFLAELSGYSIVSEPGPSTMAVEASLVDLRNSSGADLPNMRSNIRAIATPGSILFLMEMRDSQSNRVLARAADSAEAPTFATSDGVETDWASVESAAKHWAELFRIFLDENLGH